jgi:NADPH:quinone reductase-like Zn-dependent oxidoreductase
MCLFGYTRPGSIRASGTRWRDLPYLFRIAGIGVRAPKNPIPGHDVAGTVEAVGEKVTGLRPGDEVFGTCRGPFAEHACRADRLAPKPANLSFAQAAPSPPRPRPPSRLFATRARFELGSAS